ncbi:unnamed protein product [Didymodactylos carnosus]|uniref:NFX1-type zinc finger-containing protein 1 n=1 Tax=Didymodactylos carnosus TaxID=1234261 RepID=A0A8S2PZY7_9BILA|nr:unnamed protein product [Didymodactylos carnosus]CAF4071496.1 unnamed protein product [Didymodactylos carnosus]
MIYLRPSSHSSKINYRKLADLLDKEPNVIVNELIMPSSQFQAYLNHEQIKLNSVWIKSMTDILEKVVSSSTGQHELLGQIFQMLLGSAYLDGIYEETRKPVHIFSSESGFDLIRSFLMISDYMLDIMPHSESELGRIFERMEITLEKAEKTDENVKLIKSQLQDVRTKSQTIFEFKQKHRQQRLHPENSYKDPIEPPPNNYCFLSVIPLMSEILEDQAVYLRRNIIDGVYNSPEHYLDVHFRLLREDFLAPLRDGIQHYKSGAQTKNFSARVYENVRTLGSSMSKTKNLVYQLQLDARTTSNIKWENSKQLIYGSLLALSDDKFQTCALVTVEDRSSIHKDSIILVRVFSAKNFNQHYFGMEADEKQLDLSHITESARLTMLETTAYFEAYRPILQALQKISARDFPLSTTILSLNKDVKSPDYVNSRTQFDFTSLLVKSNTTVTTDTTNTFRINYSDEYDVNTKYKSVTLLDQSQWPTEKELRLNPAQRKALELALTKKVALIQGPPGTGKTYLGVKIAELLLYNRSVWCGRGSESTPVLMVCQTNHALDQFLEHIIHRLNLNKGIIRVGSRCKNPTIQRFSLLIARQESRNKREIPKEIYCMKRPILEAKMKARNEVIEKECYIRLSYSSEEVQNQTVTQHNQNAQLPNEEDEECDETEEECRRICFDFQDNDDFDLGDDDFFNSHRFRDRDPIITKEEIVEDIESNRDYCDANDQWILHCNVGNYL